MARQPQGRKAKGPRPPRKLLAIRKRYRKLGRLMRYHGTEIPILPEGKRRRDLIQEVRAWQLKRRKVVKDAG